MKRGLILAILFIIFQSSLLWADVISIPCAALLPKDHNVEYDCSGLRLVTANAQLQDFTAPVFLPTGSSITKVTLEAADNSGGEFGGYVKFTLLRAKYNTAWILSTIQSSGPDAPGDFRIDDVLSPPVLIDNSEYSYHIAVSLLNGAGGAYSIWFFKAIIEYDHPTNTGQGNTVVIPLFE
jgi:hypothetical protein